MRLKILVWGFMIFFTLLLSGCWDYEEYEDMVQVSAIGIDYDKKSRHTTLTIQYIPTTPRGGNGNTGSQAAQAAVVYSAKANTLFEALAKLQQVISKKLFFGYVKIYVIGEEAAKHTLLDIIEFLDRTPVIRTTTYILFTSGRAEDTLGTFETSMTSSSSEYIFNLINIGGTSGAAYPVSLQQLAEMLAIPGLEAAAPRVITVSKKPKPEAAGGVNDNIRFEIKRPGDHRVAGIAAFKGSKFVGWLNQQESLGYGWITGKDILAYKVYKTSGRADTHNALFYRLSKSKGKLKVEFVKGKPVFRVEVKVVADLRKYYSLGGSGFLTPKDIGLMEKKLSHSIRTDIETALRRGQKELKTDIFGFGFALFRENPTLWRNKYEDQWNKMFPKVSVEIDVQAKIINTGTNIKKFDLR